jgi:hypothetical protein
MESTMRMMLPLTLALAAASSTNPPLGGST